MRFRLSRKRVLVAAGALALVALIALSSRGSPLEVETATAQVGPLEVVVEDEGRTRAVDRYIVTAPVAGRVQRITVREGNHVDAEAVLARIEPLPLDAPTRGQLQAQLSAASARLRSARAALAQAAEASAQARRELERRRALVTEGALAAEVLEQFALALELREQERVTAQEGVRAAEADVEGVRALLSGSTGASTTLVAVRAPSSGTVLRVPERSERVVAAGEPLVEVGDPAALEVLVDVLTPDAVRIRQGMPARLTGWGGDTLHATVRRVEPSAFTRVSALGVEEQRVNVILDLAHRPAELGEGYRVDARIIVWEAAAVLTVPTSALFSDAAGWRAFVVEQGRARLRPVEVGERGDARTQVLSGLEEGETVIVFPPDDLVEGARVREAGR
jgi:HlyD family secretion protein